MLITNRTTILKEYIDNTSEKTLNTALPENIRLGVTENVRKLINYGANIYKSMDTINGNLPVLSYAVSLGNVSVVRVLTEAMYNDAKLLTSLAKENINEVEKLIEKEFEKAFLV